MQSDELWGMFPGYGNAYERTEWAMIKRVVPGKPLRKADYDIADTAEERVDKMIGNAGLVGIPDEVKEEMINAIAIVILLLAIVIFPGMAMAAERHDEISCYQFDNKPIPFKSYYRNRNKRSSYYGHSLWGGAPDTPLDSPTEVLDRLAETFADYQDCLMEKNEGVKK